MNYAFKFYYEKNVWQEPVKGLFRIIWPNSSMQPQKKLETLLKRSIKHNQKMVMKVETETL